MSGPAPPRRAPRRPGAARRRGAILFRVAVSPRIGFGHLVRALHLAGALGVPPRVSIRGGDDAAIAAARALGARVVSGGSAAILPRSVALLIIDDPSRTAALGWLRAARRAGVPVVSLHDCGMAPLASDLAFDTSLAARRVAGLGRDAGACRLGARYAVLAPAIRRRQASVVRERRPTIVIGLGGGRQAAAGLAIALPLRAGLDADPRLARVRVLLSLGWVSGARVRGAVLPPGIDLVDPGHFRQALARAAMAVVAGGTTLYEACAVGTPAVVAPVVRAQGTTVRRFVRAGLAIAPVGAGASDVGTAGWGRRVGAAAVALMADPGRRSTLARRGPRAIDGRGAGRAAAAIGQLLANTADDDGTGRGTRRSTPQETSR